MLDFCRPCITLFSPKVRNAVQIKLLRWDFVFLYNTYDPVNRAGVLQIIINSLSFERNFVS